MKLLVKTQKYGGNDISATDRMICGAVSGFIAQSITYPIDVIRRRMQTDGIIKGLPPNVLQREMTNSGVKKYHSMSITIQYIAQTEGVRGFFKGVTLNWIKGPISVAVSFTTYDTMKAFFQIDAPAHHRE